ncbi:MAG: ferrichrome ABC transporter permease, partial [Myxococcales bacterium]
MIFAVTIFVSAFLLFLVQPLIGRVILPWFGGSAGVWTTCMMFFQALLVGGYAYSHLSIAKLRPRAQALLHLSLIGLACGLVLWRTGTWGSALIPDASLKPADSHDAPLRIALLLAATVGVPYFVLSTTGPLIQAWYGRLQAGDRAYRLYALSNVGSLLALVAYPFVLEPALAVRTQSLVWTVGFVGFALCCAAAALTVARRNPAVVEPAPAAPAAEAERVPVARWLLWLTLGAAPSFMMLATTTELCNEVAVVPFLWVAPLTLYLLSFILTFDSPKWYRQGRYLVGLAVASIWTSRLHDLGASGNYRAQILAYLLTLFAFCMVCHGELVRLKPGASRLTSFYLALSVGGAVGGLLGGLLAPTVFGTLSEFRIGLVAGWLLLGAVLLASRDSALNAGLYKARRAAFATVAFVLGLTAVVSEVESARGVVVATRGFFGTLRVYKE